MSRRSFLVALALVAMLLAAAGVVLFLVVGYEPDVYAQAPAAPPGQQRTELSLKCLGEFSHLLANSKNPPDSDWYVTFSDVDINSYLDEDADRNGLASRQLPEGMRRPHVVFEPNKAHLAFRYGTGGWSTIITVDLRVWLAREEPNAVALELEGVRAGALPISGQWLIEEFARAGDRHAPAPNPAADDPMSAGLEDIADAGRQGGGLDLTWYRLNGHPVALLRFQADQAHPTLLLQGVQVDQGSLTIRGRSPEAAVHTLLMQFPPGVSRQVLD